ncbi:Sec-independent protein translocase protein TatB [Deefgea rivuli]|uniref:Sec-independent protein translocase protein TatB n=1 Tax=Deefgea rivuli TaxID=400948 RepID=UPI000687D7C6|nr:Sec-independent protein translocase protein TatB [Deefgea rivuli]
MFDISFGELLTIGAVTLIVVGPERMPKVARTAGMLLGRLQRFIANVKTELQQEMQMGELAKLEAELREGTNEIHNAIQQPFSDAANMLAEGAQMPPAADVVTDETDHFIEPVQDQHGQRDFFAQDQRQPNSAYRDRR